MTQAGSDPAPDALPNRVAARGGHRAETQAWIRNSEPDGSRTRQARRWSQSSDESAQSEEPDVLPDLASQAAEARDGYRNPADRVWARAAQRNRAVQVGEEPDERLEQQGVWPQHPDAQAGPEPQA